MNSCELCDNAGGRGTPCTRCGRLRVPPLPGEYVGVMKPTSDCFARLREAYQGLAREIFEGHVNVDDETRILEFACAEASTYQLRINQCVTELMELMATWQRAADVARREEAS